jgi:hypothetical protein
MTTDSTTGDGGDGNQTQSNLLRAWHGFDLISRVT